MAAIMPALPGVGLDVESHRMSREPCTRERAVPNLRAEPHAMPALRGGPNIESPHRALARLGGGRGGGVQLPPLAGTKWHQLATDRRPHHRAGTRAPTVPPTTGSVCQGPCAKNRKRDRKGRREKKCVPAAGGGRQPRISVQPHNLARTMAGAMGVATRLGGSGGRAKANLRRPSRRG